MGHEDRGSFNLRLDPKSSDSANRGPVSSVSSRRYGGRGSSTQSGTTVHTQPHGSHTAAGYDESGITAKIQMNYCWLPRPS